jgi:hypothetical protein
MNTKQTKEALKILLKKEEKQIFTPLIIGKPGIGKSEIINQIHKEFEYDHILDIRLSQHDNTDIKGIPKPNKSGSGLQWLSPEFMPIEGSQYEGTTGILFFDEINRAQPDVLQSIFQIVYDRSIGTKKILPEWKIVCAGNLGFEDGCDVIELDNALKNRFATLKIDEINIDIWCEWAIGNNVNPDIIKFLKTNPNYFYVDDKSADFIITPRSWVKFGELLIQNKTNEIEITKLLGETIIYSATPLFVSFLEANNKVSPKQVFNNIQKIKKQLNELERQDIYELNEKILFYIKDRLEKKKNAFTKENCINFKKYFESHLNDDNKIALLENIKTHNLLSFLNDYLFKHCPELDSNELGNTMWENF